MLITRKFGKLLLGATIPFQLYTACILGALLGLLPGFVEAPALLICLAVLVLVFNCNLFLMGLAVLVSKALTLALLPVYFQVGRFLLDGPTQGLFKGLINAPVFALFGFEYYVLTGGLLPTLVIGIAGGFVITSIVRKMQRTYVSLDKGSASFHAWTNKGWVKFLTWLLLGAKPDPAVYEKLLGKRIGNPIRVVGVIAAVVLVAAVVIFSLALSGPLMTNLVRESLERANGATVDLEAAELVLKDSRLTVRKLAVADRQDLATDIFRAETINCDISGLDLLRKRLHLSKVEVSGAISGAAREVPGQLTRPREEVIEEPPEGEGKTIEDYIEDAEKWQQRLQQAQKWLEKMSGPERPEDLDQPAGKEKLEERLSRQIRDHGYSAVQASHLIDSAPTVLVSELIVNDMPVKDLEERMVSVRAANLSTQPYLVAAAPEVHAASDDGAYALDIVLGEAAQTPSANSLQLKAEGLPLEELMDELKSAESKVRGGLLDVTGDGSWSKNDGLDLPADLVLRDMTVAGFTDQPIVVDRVEMRLRIYGPLSNPRIQLTGGSMGDALKSTGQRELEKRAGEELKKLGVDEETSEKAKGLLNKFLGSGDDDK